MTWIRAVKIVAVVLTATAVALGVGGYAFFTRASEQPLRRADAIIVLGGEHDGREAYGIELARRGFAPVVVLSDPYDASDSVMREKCSRTTRSVEVICRRPDPLTTRGEAIFTRRLADERHWSSVIVVTWRYHLARASYIFDRCMNDPHLEVIPRAVPRDYDMSPLGWAEVYGYQYAGFVKAFAQGSCPVRALQGDQL